MHRTATALVALLPLLSTLACSKSESKNAPPSAATEGQKVDPSAEPSTSQRADPHDPWVRHIEALRAHKDREFKTSPTSPMAGVQFLKSKPTTAVHVSRADPGPFVLAYADSPNPVLSLTRSEDSWSFRAGTDTVTARRGAQVLADGSTVDNGTTFAIDRFTISAYVKDGTITLKIFDPMRAELKHFEHLHYYPPDKKYALPAALKKLDERSEVVMMTSQNLQKTLYSYAKIAFELDGKEQELTAFKYALSGPSSNYLFIPYKDATSGKETYGAGRYLEFKEPANEQFTLDFNESYNPLCNYSSAYNCPIPPRENRLQVAIRAGEKTYPH